MTDPLDTAIHAAREAGKLLRENFGAKLDVSAFEAHDIKLELDVRSQTLITNILLDAFPDHAIYGEEGIAGNQESDFHWIVDPIDGTVNYFYSIPHFCISIALRERGEIIVGVIYDPMRDELWQVRQGGPPLLNGNPIAVSARQNLGDCILSVGFSKSKTTIDSGLPVFEQMVYRARKCRLMGSAALDLAYVACGRLDAYIEQSVSLWDVAAGKILVESAGGRVVITERPDVPNKLSIVASNGCADLGL
ncbi:MAG: monophosphatase [Chthoniobacter sp.]|jgi:myo-inositol-1(or 4)-monophosphatase|nr:monophosphatase [Chthoniobacter sp.]